MDLIESEQYEIRITLAVRALRKSNIRRRVAEYLCTISPSYSYIAEIARHIKSSSTDVIGVIRGSGVRYREDMSLISLGIIEMKNANGEKLYRITPFGKKVLDALRVKV
jgi:predicted transcriptional regulator with HTH domain